MKTQLIVRDRPMMRLRIRADDSQLSLEWAGRTGHPSSYGLLAGARSTVPGLNVPAEGGRYRQSLARSADEVYWGLPEEYRASVAEVLAEQPTPLTVTQAAHGLIGSSILVFRCLASMLAQVARGGTPVDDVDIWHLFDANWETGRLRP